MTEHEMVEEAVNWFRARGYKVATEVACFGQSIDLVYEDEMRDLIAIEFKLRDWRQAIQQAKTHILAAKSVYICLPNRTVTPKLHDGLCQWGIGLLLYNDGANPLLQEVLAPVSGQYKLQFPAQWLRDGFEFRLRESIRTVIPESLRD